MEDQQPPASDLIDETPDSQSGDDASVEIDAAETEVEQDGKRFLLRSAPRPAASRTLAALGVALPPTLRQIDLA